ncbi:cell wall-binding protein [Desulfosporosinus acidiphilus SJ4]|uniref:Cell wall-binding protein n=1 Tax=Desulfosporosinus acidiphilus (strain DSM 22704 / JCM 16185 / SJ4) TaxID=646529 RepID=I4D416_DESAJ|nr:cell wall-binding repeat-containing protein [Desulfosporosinus acidiphilus]AFM40540.1 cell wall-binding protein [Desulfosporosinus acidiphilus SJ4]
MKAIKQKLLGGIVTILTLVCVLLPAKTVAASNQIDPSMTRIYGNDRYETAAKVAEVGWAGTSNYAILSAGMDANLIDALTVSPLAAKLNAPILLTEGDSLNNFARQELTRLGVKKVYITSGAGVIHQQVIDQVKAIPTVTDVEVLGGIDASQTSVNVANELAKLGVPISKAIVVGGNGVDALSVSSIAGAQDIPILYSPGKTLSGYVSAYLNGIKSVLTKTYIIGGTGVISNTAASQLSGTVERVAGQDKYDTNIQVLQAFAGILKYKNTYLANGDTLVDALAVSPLAAKSGSPILLTSQTLPSASVSYAQANLSPNVIALGGEVVVPSSDLTQLSSQQVISQDGTTQGATDSTNRSQINSALKITGNSVILNNSAANDSIYIQGNNDTLNNVETKGTIFVDVDSIGTVNLENVTAANIVILSGASNSIDLQDVTSNSLIDASGASVYLISSGTTNISQTIFTSSANVDTTGGGSFGQITISNASQLDPTPSVEFTGTFTQPPITVNDSASVVVAPNASVANVVVAAENSSQTVTLQGPFTNVTVTSPSAIQLGSNTRVQSLTNNSKTSITVQTLVNNSPTNIAVPSLSSITGLNTGVAVVYNGEDSGASSNQYGNDFYIGQLGYGTHQHFEAGGDDAGGKYFNSTGASNATQIYGYWLISGMSMAPAGASATAWGQQQAQAADKAFNDMSQYYGSKVKLVLFADVEAIGGGLDAQDYTNNQAIYTAFVNWLKQNSTVKPGTYSSPHEWNTQTMGTNFVPLTPGNYWVADYPGGTPDQSILTTSNQYWVEFPQTSEQAQIWQFEGTPDYDVASFLPG